MAEKYYSWSPYAYVMNNPLKYVDPDGRATDLPPSVKQAMFAAKNPKIANRIGTYSPGSGNISTTAGNFGINLTKAMGQTVVGEGNHNNALRHVMWQAIITNEYGDDIAKEAGNAHEQDVDKVDYNQMTHDKLADADKLADLANNVIGRGIGRMNKGSSNVDLAKKVVEYFSTHGLYTVESKDGQYSVTSTKLTGAEAQAAFKMLQELGNNGLNKPKKEDDEK